MAHRRAPLFADRPTALASTATAAALVALVASDAATQRRAGDRVADAGTGALVAGAIAAAVGTSVASLGGRDRPPLPRHRNRFWAGVLTTWAGIGLNRWGKGALGPAYRPVVTVLADHDVVDHGPYRVVRHPMYAGSTLLCLGVGTALGTRSTALAWALPPLALVRRIVVEERVLARELGERYGAFARGRARLVPGVW